MRVRVRERELFLLFSGYELVSQFFVFLIIVNTMFSCAFCVFWRLHPVRSQLIQMSRNNRHGPPTSLDYERTFEANIYQELVK